MDCPRPRAADDFDIIRQRLEELRREREAAEAAEADAGDAPSEDNKTERRRRERLEGSPPPWAPTIFAKPLGR